MDCVRKALGAVALVLTTACLPWEGVDTDVLTVEPTRLPAATVELALELCRAGTFAEVSPTFVPRGFEAAPLELASPFVGKFSGHLNGQSHYGPWTLELVPTAVRAYVPRSVDDPDRAVLVSVDLIVDGPPYFVDDILSAELCFAPGQLAGLIVEPHPREQLAGTFDDITMPWTHLSMDLRWEDHHWRGLVWLLGEEGTRALGGNGWATPW